MNNDIFVTKSSMPSFEEYINEIRDIWDSHWLSNMGRHHKEFEERLKNYLGVENIELFTNGHLALELTIQAMGLTGEVITTPFTFASTTHAIVRNNLTPVFCDVRESDYTIDPEKIESLITDKTSAIVPVHVYGNICDIDAIDAIAKKHGLKVIYDAAHAFGENYHGKSVLEYGDASICSFHATKVFNSIEGGCCVYHDKHLGEELYGLKNFGIRDETIVNLVGSNAKMNEFQASMGVCNLRHVDEDISKRKEIYEQYIESLGDIKELIFQPFGEIEKANYAYMPMLVEKNCRVGRDELYDALLAKGIHSRKYFYPITNTFECYSGKYDCASTPVALDISHRVLTLPIYPDLSRSDVDRICEVIKNSII